jgi:hypothetical protein
MKKWLLLLLLIPQFSKAQYYCSFMPAFYTGSGSTAQRTTCDVEFGKQWDAFSIGLDLGKTNLAQRGEKDTTFYTELRPNLNVFQQGKFTNTLTIGLGYVFNAHQNILTEFTTGIEYTFNKNFSYNLYFGTYYFSGEITSSNQNFFGISITYFFTKTLKNK